MRQIADPEIRKQYSEMILKMRNNDEKAIEFIEHALVGIMEPEFTARKEMTVLGLMGHFASENEDHEGIWKRYMAYHDKISSSSVDGAHYGVYFDTEIGVDYLAGMSVGGVEEAPEGLTLRDVPAAHCAVFSCAAKTIGETYDKILRDWLPTSQCEHDTPLPVFERYPPNTRTGDGPVLIYIPVRKKL